MTHSVRPRHLFVLLLCTLVAVEVSGCAADCHDGECIEPTSGGPSSSSGGEVSALALEYCDCMLLSCHDAYHASFGPDTDEEAARNNCIAEAETVAVADSDVTQGDFIECRIHHCEVGKTDEMSCPSSVGDGMCM